MTGRPVVNLRSAVPPYVQIADLIRARISSGELQAGDRLEAHADMGHRYGASKHTVARAMYLLRQEGLVEPGRGSGTFVRDPWPRRVVTVPSGATISARMPTPAERQSHDMEEGVPLLIVDHAGMKTIYPGDRFDLRAS